MIELKLNLKPLLKKLELSTKRSTIAEMVGEYRTVFKGRGLDFEGYRVYSPTEDDASFIDWKASLRANDLLVKMLQEERFLKVLILMDISNSMLFSSHEKLKCEFAAELIASLSFVILHAGDSVGLMMFNNKVVRNIPVNLGSKQYFLITQALSNPANYGGQFDIVKILRIVLNSVRSQTSIIILSDFIGMPPEFQTLIKILGTKCDISGIMIRDPVDNVLPIERKQILLQDPYSDATIMIDPRVIKEEYDLKSKQERTNIKNIFLKAHSSALDIQTNQEFVTPIIKFFQERKLRWK
jgi:uncharacterized protein (DUF58 family)